MLDFFKNLFQKQTVANSPVLHELIARTNEEKHQYEIWKLNNHKDYLVGFLAKQFDDYFTTQSPKTDNLLILHTQKSRGFMLTYQPVQATAQQFQYLFDYLKEQVKKLNYSVYVSDVKNFARPTYVQTIERHYLKPRFSVPDEQGKLNQLYGNITIEHLLHNDQPIQIKFICHPYSDHNFTQPLHFKDLMQQILL